MSARLEGWLAERRPQSSLPLTRWTSRAPSDTDTPPVRSLMSLGREALDTALARPGRVRESAFELLTADALTTYAAEAALEADDPEGELVRLAECFLGGGDGP